MKPPKTRNAGTWTESAFKSFIRSMLRKGSFRWVPRKQALLAARRKSQSTNKLLKWEFQCAECGEWFPQKQVAVDHIEPCGSIEDLNEFVARMYPEDPKAFQVLCKGKGSCHQKKTNKEREARIESKKKKEEQA